MFQRIGLIVVAMFVMLAGQPAWAQASAPSVYVNGKPLKAAVLTAGTVRNDVYVGMKALLGQFGFRVAIQQTSITASSDKLVWKSALGSGKSTVNGQSLVSQLPVKRVKDTVYVPLRTVADVLGADLTVAGTRFDLTTDQPEARFMRAFANRDKKLMSAIIRNGINLGNFHYGTQPIEAAIGKNDADMVSFLIQQGSNINRIGNAMDYQSPLNAAIAHRAKDVIAYLLAAGADVNLVDGKMQLPLNVAIAAGDTALVQELLKRKAVPSPAISGQFPPIYTALRNHHADIALLLAQAGANVFQPLSGKTLDVFDDLYANADEQSYIPQFLEASSQSFVLQRKPAALNFRQDIQVTVDGYYVLADQAALQITVKNDGDGIVELDMGNDVAKAVRSYMKMDVSDYVQYGVTNPYQPCYPADKQVFGPNGKKIDVVDWDSLNACNRQIAAMREKADESRRMYEEWIKRGLIQAKKVQALETIKPAADKPLAIVPMETKSTETYYLFLPRENRSDQTFEASIAVDGKTRTRFTLRFDTSSPDADGSIPNSVLQAKSAP